GPLPRQVRSPGLRLKAAVILTSAEMLAAKLGKQDPLARRVALSKPERMRAGLRGVVRGLTGR
ncbi:MAG: squalene synthase HpnC, partial [Alphaproteobacteria bacterium]